MTPDLSPAEWRQLLTRRSFLNAGVQGIGTVALSALLSKDLFAAKPDALGALPGLPHFAPKAKRVICLWQGGGPSHVDLFDQKPTLAKEAGKDIPAGIRGDTRGSPRCPAATRSGPPCRRSSRSPVTASAAASCRR